VKRSGDTVAAMPRSRATTVDDYLASLPADRRATIAAVRKVVRKNLPRGFEEGMQLGMIAWYVPLETYPDTYNGQPLQLAALAAQKSHNAIYLMSVYSDPALETWFVDACRKTGKQLDMGKSCVRFESLDDLALEVVGEAIAKIGCHDFIAQHEKGRAAAKKKTVKAKR